MGLALILLAIDFIRQIGFYFNPFRNITKLVLMSVLSPTDTSFFLSSFIT